MKISVSNFSNLKDIAQKRLCPYKYFPVIVFISLALFFGSPYIVDYKQKMLSAWRNSDLIQMAQSSLCKGQHKPIGCENLPQGIISSTSNFELRPIWDVSRLIEKETKEKEPKSLLAIAAGIKQKKVVDEIVKKFFSSNFTVMIFHYDGNVDKWRDLKWNDAALHVSAMNQSKWWFAKRFLHPGIVAEYDYIFLWDEDLGVEHFHPNRYISIIKKEKLEISQPALDGSKSLIHYPITARNRKGDVHRRVYKYTGGSRCYENSTAPPCTGWVEMMAPVFSNAAWRCVWHMVQNDLIHAWGLDKMLGYCAQGDRTKYVGVVDSEYIVHLGIPTLGSITNQTGLKRPKHGSGSKNSSSATTVPSASSNFDERSAIRMRSFAEAEIFTKRWRRAVKDDKCWIDHYPQPENKTNT